MRFHRHRERGALLIVLLILMVVITMVGVWGLQSSKEGLMRAGHFRGTAGLYYNAEDGFRRAVQRLGEISKGSDSVANRLGETELTLNDLLTNLCQPSDAICDGKSTPACPEEFDPEYAFDIISADPYKSDTICNFLGTVLRHKLGDTQVTVTRKDDFREGTKTTAVFLVNSIARDTVGRRRVLQGVVVIPYILAFTGQYILVPNDTVSVAGTNWVRED